MLGEAQAACQGHGQVPLLSAPASGTFESSLPDVYVSEDTFRCVLVAEAPLAM